MYDWAEFRHFRYLLAILEKQGFRSVAEELHTSQPNLTVQARQFQENSTVKLFRRLKDGRIRPTETGRAFVELARSLLEMREEVIDALIAIERGEIANVRLGSSPLVDQELFRSFCATHKTILPTVTVRPTHGDTRQLAEEILSGTVDAAIITLPLEDKNLHIEEVRRDRLVVCLRRDNPLASKLALRPSELQDNLAILYHPQRHPDAHDRLLELLAEEGVMVEEYSRASHPSEMQMLVKEGYGFALIREGTRLDEELITRPIAGVDWTVDTAVVYHKQRRPKSIPLLLRKFKKLYRTGQTESSTRTQNSGVEGASRNKAPASTHVEHPIQLNLLG